MAGLKSVGVYCGSSNNVPEQFKSAAKDLGNLLARSNLKMVYGGGVTGLMGICASACAQAGGYVIGITTNYLEQYEGGHTEIAELHVVNNMHERKLKMFELSEAFICLPGGLGTLDETFEVLTWKQIGLHQKNIIFVNINNYWDPLVNNLMDTIVRNGFMRNEDCNLFRVVNSVDETLQAISVVSESPVNFVAKWG